MRDITSRSKILEFMRVFGEHAEDHVRVYFTGGTTAVLDYDLYSQALSKIERGHQQDILDVETMFARRMIEPAKLQDFYNLIEPDLYLYPAIDPKAFSRAVTEFIERVKPFWRSS